MITGLAALALHGFAAAPPPAPADAVDVLVPRTRRLRSVGYVRLVRSAGTPRAEQLRGLPVVPVERALADAIAGLGDPLAVRGLLIEAVRGGHCEPAVVVRELSRAKLLGRPQVVAAVDSFLAEGRAVAEGGSTTWCGRTSCRSRCGTWSCGCPAAPCSAGWTPTGPSRRSPWSWTPGRRGAAGPGTAGDREEQGAQWSAYAARREHLERLGITVVHLTPGKLRDAGEQQAVVVRTALMAAAYREPAAQVTVLPR